MPDTPKAHADLVQAFANTLDVEEGTDALGSPDGLAAWLHEHSLGDVGAPQPKDLALARSVRDGLRDLFAANHDRTSDRSAMARLEEQSAALPLRVVFDADGGPSLAPAATGVRGALAGVLASAVTLAAHGQWRRLKLCSASGCRWAYYDESKNRSRRWCSMEVCGNRQKARAYRARQLH